MKGTLAEADLLKYLETFHAVLGDAAEKHIEKEFRARLRHLSLLPATVVGFLSTQFGVAIRYFPATTTTFSVRVGSGRIEQLLFSAPARLLKRRPLASIGGHSTVEMSHVSVGGLLPFMMKSTQAEVVLHQVVAHDADWRSTVEYAEAFGDRSLTRWSPERAALRATEEVLHALTDLRRARAAGVSVEDFVRERKKSTVLLLGSFDQEGLGRLGALKLAVGKAGYEPVLLSEVPDHPAMTLAQKVCLMGSIARFIIIDDTAPSGHLVEIALCREHDWPAVILRPNGTPSSFMAAGLGVLRLAMKELPYEPGAIADAVPAAAEWAESHIRHLRRELPKHYPWRMPEDDTGS